MKTLTISLIKDGERIASIKDKFTLSEATQTVNALMSLTYQIKSTSLPTAAGAKKFAESWSLPEFDVATLN